MSSNFQLGMVGNAWNHVCTSGRCRLTSFTSHVHSSPLRCSSRICLCICGGEGPNCCCHRSEEHTSELQPLMRISYAAVRLKKTKRNTAERMTQHLPTIHD